MRYERRTKSIKGSNLEGIEGQRQTLREVVGQSQKDVQCEVARTETTFPNQRIFFKRLGNLGIATI